jgi:hypothetical protein
MLVLSMKAGEAVTIGHDIPGLPVAPDIPYRHHYRCWLCKCEGVLEFEPDALEPSWTECRNCGLDNEISPGLYDRPTIIPGHAPSRMF